MSIGPWGSHQQDIDLTRAWQWLLGLHDGKLPTSPLRWLPPDHWQCTTGVSAEASELLDCLTPLAGSKRLVIAQLGQSLDGRIATHTGHSHYINGQQSLIHLHRLRALVDAVVIGVGTALADNPRLTVRHVEGRHPARVILDPNGRLSGDLDLLQDRVAPTLHLVGRKVDCRLLGTGLDDWVTQMALDTDASGQFAPADVIRTLNCLGYWRVLVEGGGVTVSRFIEAGCTDRLHLLVAPLLIGSGRPGLQMTPIDRLTSALRPATRRFSCGDDTLFDICLTPA